MTDPRVQLREGLEREPPAMELRVRHVEPGLIHHPLSPEEDVEVEEARAPPLGADAAVCPLDIQEGGQQGRGAAAGDE